MNFKDGDKSAKPEETDVEEVLEAQAKAEGQTYSDFLKPHQLLALQPGFDNNSDPLMFFTLHQIKELWMRVMCVETISARDSLLEGQVGPALKTLARVRSIQQIMIES